MCASAICDRESLVVSKIFRNIVQSVRTASESFRLPDECRVEGDVCDFLSLLSKNIPLSQEGHCQRSRRRWSGRERGDGAQLMAKMLLQPGCRSSTVDSGYHLMGMTIKEKSFFRPNKSHTFQKVPHFLAVLKLPHFHCADETR